MSSKLERYVDTLKVLEQRGPLKVSNIKFEANVSTNTVKGYLEFLMKQGLVEERVVGKRSVVYANTACGTSVIKFFTELDKTLTAIEDGKNFPVPIEPDF